MQARHAQNSGSTATRSGTLPAKATASGPAANRDATSARAEKASARSEKTAEKSVEFTLHNPAARSVGVAGSFNGWDAKRNPMQKGDAGAWKAKVTVPPGRHEYRFVVDGQWVSDPSARESVQNAYGSSNSVMIVR